MAMTDINGINLSGVTGKLIQTVPLTKNPAPQAIASDPVNGHVFVLQMESAAKTPLGNMYLNRIDRTTGRLTGSMYLTGFGHGISMGAEPVGTDTYLWTEVGPVSPTTASATPSVRPSPGSASSTGPRSTRPTCPPRRSSARRADGAPARRWTSPTTP